MRRHTCRWILLLGFFCALPSQAQIRTLILGDRLAPWSEGGPPGGVTPIRLRIDGSTTVLDTDYFRLDVIDGEIEVDTQFTFAAVTATAGHVTLSGDKQECVLGPGDTAMIPAGQNVRVCPAPEVGRCLIATPTT